MTNFLMGSKAKIMEAFQDKLARLYPEFTESLDSDKKYLSRTVTFMVTNDCSLRCTYCYETHKGHDYMTFDTAKKFIDLLLSGEKGFSSYIDPSFSKGIILEFIGGEPLLAIDLIDQVVDYFKIKAIELGHVWAQYYMITICTNGVSYFDPRVQKFLNKNLNNISLSITIDGDKELHDSCRVFPDGSGSYDIAVAAAKDWISKGFYIGSKVTISPGNINHLRNAILHMVDLGYTEINTNCVYEEGWTQEHAIEFYRILKDLANYWIGNDMVETHYLSLFSEKFFRPKAEDDLGTWCGGTGDMLAVDWRGNLYPCVRYVDTSLGDEREPVILGNIDDGIGQTQCTKDCIECMKKINRRTKMSDECFYCPIAEGCSECSAYNYQVTGSMDSHVTYICEMHKARALANVYFWNTYYRKNNIDQRMECYVPEDWALNIISKEEYDMLIELSNK